MNKTFVAAALLALGAGSAEAQSAQLASSRPARSVEATAARAPSVGAAIRAVSGAPRVDGRLDDAAWQGAPVMSGFTQRDPDEGQPGSERTEVRVVYTDDAIFVGVRAHDSRAGEIRAQLTRRDADSPSDWIAIGIDSYYDRRTAYVFQVNPLGVKRDSYLFDDTNEDDSWDAVWDVEVSRDSEGWTAEFRIPFSQLRFARADAHTFGFQVHRVIARRNETQQWRYIPKTEQGMVSKFGDLRGFEALQPPRRLEVLPYTVARGERSRISANPFNDGRRTAGDIGADIKYGLTSNLTLDVAINPDFGQVEQDPAFINLGPFQQFQEERRPFFTEGVNIFRFDGNTELFYSRRIGRAPQGWADPRGGFAEQVPNTTILGAAKLSGRTQSGWNIGLLAAYTTREVAGVEDSLGVRHQDVVEPRATYLVGRLAREWNRGRTVLGVFGTALNRDVPANLSWLNTGAYTGAMDFSHRFGGDALRLRAWLGLTHVRGAPEAMLRMQTASRRNFQRPDNDYRDVDSAATSMSGWGGGLSLGDEAGAWRWRTGVGTRSPEFEVNDIGFSNNVDYVEQFNWVQRRWTRPGRVFRSFNLNINQWQGWNYGGDRMFQGSNINGNGQFLNYWGMFGGMNRQFSGFNAAELRGGPMIRRPGGWANWIGFYSDRRKAISGEAGFERFDQDENATRHRGYWQSVSWRPASAMEFSLGPSYNFVHDNWLYAATVDVGGQTVYLLSETDQRFISANLRANLTFSPTLTLQAYVAPFYATVERLAFKRLTDPRAASYAGRFAPVNRDPSTTAAVLDVDGNGSYETDLGNMDFSYTSLNSNLVLRWEYRPGSTVFVVWQQGRSANGMDGTFRMGDVGRSIVAARPTNVFLVKVNYWLSL
jgi:hypothetical protein